MASDDKKNSPPTDSPPYMTYFMVAVVGVLFLALLFHKAPTPVVHIAAHENSFARAMKMDKKAMRFEQVEVDAETAATRALRDTESELARGTADRKGMSSGLQVSKQTRLTADD